MAHQAAYRASPRPVPFDAAAGYRILQRITVAIRSQVDIGRVLDGLVADAGRLLELRLCALARWSEDGDALHVTHEFRRDRGGSSLTLMGRRVSPHPDAMDQGFARLVFTNQRSLVRPASGPSDVRLPADEPALPAALAGLEDSALVIAPLVCDQRAAGLLVAARSADLPAWSEEDLEFLRAITDLAAVALQHNSLRYRLGRFCAFSSEIRAPLEPGLLLRRLVETAIMSLQASGGMAGVREGSDMVCREVRRGSAWHPLELRLRPGQGLPGWCWSNRAACVSNEMAQDSRADADLVKSLGVSSSLTVPLVDRSGEVTGFLELHDKSAGLSFGEEDIVLATALAHQAALALEILKS